MNIWLTAQECIGLPAMPSAPFNVINKLKRGANSETMRKRDGSKAFEFHINCLPPVARAAVLKQRGTVEINERTFVIPKKTETRGYCSEALWQGWNEATAKQQDKAKLKCEAVQAVADLIASGVDTVATFSSVAAAFDVAPASVRRWYYAAIKFERADWLAVLVSQHGKSAAAKKAKEAEFTSEAWDFITADYLRSEKTSLRTCYARLKEAARAHGWTIPSLSTVQRKIEREIPIEQITLLREGEHAVMSMYPAQERTILELDAMEWINGDGYQHNVFVEWFNGEILRPKTWVWQDIRTRKIVGWRTDVSENSDSIRLALADVIENYGIPKNITIDNTRAAANKWLTGGVPNRYRFKVKPDDPKGIIPLLGIKLHWTSVLFGRGHGQAKPVERAFSHGGLGEVVDKHPLLAGAYTGANPIDKPDNYGSRVVSAEIFIKALADGIAFWNRQQGRNTEACRGELSFDEAFEQSYAKATVRKATAEQRHLLLLPSEAVNVRDDGTFVLDAGGSLQGRKNRYFDESLIGIKPNKIVIRFDPQNLHNSVLVYTLDGRFICEATCLDKVGFGDTQAAREHKRMRTQFVKRTKEANTAAKRMTALEVAELMPEISPPPAPETKVVQMTRNVVVGNTVRQQVIHADSATVIDKDAAFENAVSSLYERRQKNQI